MSDKKFEVIKLGGNTLRRGVLTETFFSDLRQLTLEKKVLIVHGGGPQMNEAAAELGHNPTIKHGRRVTGDVDLAILDRVLGQELNQQLVTDLQDAGIEAAGIRASDGIVFVHKRPPVLMDDEWVDFGWVGDVEKVERSPLDHILSRGKIPVIATMGSDSAGQLFNVNGDTVAMEIAKAVGAKRLHFVTELGQVLDQKGTGLDRMTPEGRGTGDIGILVGGRYES